MQWFNLRCRQKKPVSLPLYEEYLKGFDVESKKASLCTNTKEASKSEISALTLKIKKLN